MTAEIRNTNLMTDNEWNRRYEALDDDARAKMQHTAGALGVNLRSIDPAQYSAEYHQQQQEQMAALEDEKELQRLKQPVSIRPEMSDRDLAATARRLGVSETVYTANYRTARAAEIQAEAERKEALEKREMNDARAAANQALEAFGRAVGAIE